MASSTGLNCSKPPQLLTLWRAKDRHYQQAKIAARHQPFTSCRAKDWHHQHARIAARHHNHLLSGEPRTGIISRLELQQGTHNHSHSREPKTGMISKLELQQGTIATHILESHRQASLTGQNCSKAPQLLTSWRAKNRHHQQVRIAARQHSYSHPGEPRTGIINRLGLQQGTTATHKLESQGHASSAGYNCSRASQPLTC